MFILDIMLPGIDGFELCKKIKEKKSLKNIPLIMLTAKGEEINKVIGLEIGADDYITKPFSVREFTARVKALFRRANAKDEDESDILEYKDIVLDIKRYEAKKDGKTIELTHKEFELLRMLIKNAGQVLTRELMLEKVWGFDYFGETRTVDVHIRFLRKKLENEDENLQYIETVRGVGYRLKDK
jgi:two-component system alkaline phosphatase synthesis response regulator PhoP